ncbi:MAG: Gfo/Idh/MocA family oxidoreductase [Planctomycetota bacterium]|nr:Gfo/Idh/MocA family oxidoreductase [Planctomycetota bacterium]
MSTLESLNVGVVGACGRGGFATHPVPGVRLHALCDINREALDAAAAKFPGVERWADFGEMIDKSKIDMVVVGTPMPLHVPQSIAALRRGLHVMSEVPAGVGIEECRELVLACRQAKGLYMMAENMNYFRPMRIVTEMVRRGLFGKTYYAEGEYLHELRDLTERTPWRRKWALGTNGVTYGTHSLGPILQWMPGDRVTSVCSVGAGQHHVDAAGKPYELEDCCVMLCRMQSGGLVKIRMDFTSDRPSAHRFCLQGTDGCLESSAVLRDPDRIWLRSRCEGRAWRTVEEFAEELLPESWKRAEADAKSAGHGGSDYMQLLDFVTAIRTNGPSPIGVHEAMDMTLPGLVSQKSILEAGRWLDVPDSRTW